MGILKGNEYPIAGDMQSPDSPDNTIVNTSISGEWDTSGKECTSHAISQPFKRFMGKSNYKDKGIRWLSIINTLEKGMKDWGD